MLDRRQFYIDGAWVPAIEGREIEVLNPADEAPFARITLGGAADLERAAAAARAAFERAPARALDERVALLERLLAIYRRREDEMAALMTREMGAPITFSREVQAASGSGHIEATLEALRSFRFEEPSPRGGSEIVYEPVGVCALITPWNWPINQIVAKVLPALAAGCTCVLKPSELAPLSAMLFAEMLDEARCPPGAFNLVNGDGAGVGAAMAAHPAFDMVSLTGSTRAGIAVGKAAADTVKRVTLELGGNSPNLVFADADLEAAVGWSVRACFSNSGQSCDSPGRLLVERAVYDRALGLAGAVAAETRVGDPTREGEHLGPLVSQAQFDKVQALIAAGIDEGARLVCGGTGRPDGFPRGYYVKPTVFADVRNDMRVAREEIFGPVLTVIPFDDEAGGIRIANDTPYGLAAFVHTGDPGRARRVARALRAGSISVNGAMQDYDSPFGGYKHSGNGREYGAYGLHDYLEIKTITSA